MQTVIKNKILKKEKNRTQAQNYDHETLNDPKQEVETVE